MQKRILVTGGAGFIGSHLVDYLLRHDHKVTVLDDFSTGRWENLEEAKNLGDIKVIEGSITNLKTLQASFEDCDTVFHLAVQCVRRCLSRPLENHEINSTGTLNVLEEARKMKIKKFIYCSSSEVYGNSRDLILKESGTVCEPMTVYGASKLAGEYYTKAYHRTYGMPVSIVRPFNTFGPREHMHGDLAEVIPRFVIRILNGLSPVIFGDGSNGRDFTYIDDTVEGIYKTFQCDELIGREVNIAFGRVVTMKELAKMVTDVCGKSEISAVYSDHRPGDVLSLHADISLASQILNFKAHTSLEEGLKKYVSWLKMAYPDPTTLLEEKIQNWSMPAA